MPHTLTPVDVVLTELAQTPNLLQNNWCVSPTTGQMLALLANTIQATAICEVGTSIGYSTLWLAQAVAPRNGTVDTLDASPERQTQAIENFKRAGLDTIIRPHLGDALVLLEAFQAQGRTFGLAFIDASKQQYIGYFQLLDMMLHPGGLLIADNTQSHRDEMQDFLKAITQHPLYEIADLETPSGQLIARKRTE